MNLMINIRYCIIGTIVLSLICSGFTFWMTQKHYIEKYNALQSEYNSFKAKYSVIVEEKEAAIIAKAKAEKAAKTPVVEYVKGETVTEIKYVEKDSKDDATFEFNSKANPIYVSYNGQKEAIKTTTKDGKQIVDGKLVMNQETTATLYIDSIVNRQIANTILEKEKKERELERQKSQNLIWGIVGGYVVGKTLKK